MAGIIERTQPRISINKLGEYMTATPARRRLIVADQRRPKGFLVPRYNEAQAAIASYLTDPRRDVSPLLQRIEQLHNARVDSAWEAQRNRSCGEALEAFLEIANQFPVDIRLERGPGRPPVAHYGQVAISVRPELVARRLDREGALAVGAIKLYFSKTAPLAREAGGFIATALADFTEEFLAIDARADYRLCQVIDVFAKKRYSAPRSRVRRRQEIAAACDEIARAWLAA